MPNENQWPSKNSDSHYLKICYISKQSSFKKGKIMIKRYCLLIFILLSFTSKCVSMHICELFVDLFKNDPIPTEYTAYCLLRDNPLKATVTYLAVPWAVLINTNQLHKVPPLHLENGFTICQHVRFKEILPLLHKMGVKTLFTPHASPSDIASTQSGVQILPFPHYAVNSIAPSINKDIFYSFIGYDNHPVRTALFNNTKHPENSCIIKRANWYFYSDKIQLEKEEYQDCLSRSRFSLCPRGAGSGTLRFWESLEAGAVPVSLSDDLTLPKDFDWPSCVIFIKESDVQKIDTILRTISPQQENAMRQACLAAFKQFSGGNFISCIRNFFELKTINDVAKS